MFDLWFQAAFPSFYESGGAFVLEIVCKSILIFLLTGAALALLRRSSASVRAFVWRLALFALLLLPILSLCLPALQLAVRRPVPVGPSNVGSMPSSPPVFVPPAGSAHTEAAPSPAFSSALEPVGSTALPPTRRLAGPLETPQAIQAHPEYAAVLLWAAGALFLLARMGTGIAALRTLQNRVLPTPRGLNETGQALVRQYSIRRKVRILTDPGVYTTPAPLTWGWLSPCILLPSDAERWTDERLQAVLTHELAHIARCDWPVLMLCDAAVALYWFHPLIWVLKRQLRGESEQACDDRALASGIKAADYAAHLLEIVRLKKSARRIPLAAISMAHPSLLETRLHALLQPNRSRRPVSRAAALLAIGGLAALLSPISAAHVAVKPVPAVVADRTDRENEPDAFQKIGVQKNHDFIPAADENAPAALPDKMGDEPPQSGAPNALLPTASDPHTIQRSPIFARRPPSAAEEYAAIARGKPDAGIRARLERSGGAGPGHLMMPEDVKRGVTGTGGLPIVMAAPPSNAPGALDRAAGKPMKKTALDGVQWGAIKDGLQAGIRIAGVKRSFSPGERITCECYIRNISDHNIAFSYGAHYYLENRPIVHDAANPAKDKKVTGLLLTSSDAGDSLLLAPGETVAASQPELGLGKYQDPVPESEISLSRVPYLDEPSNGAYTIEQTLLYYLSTEDEVRRLAKRSESKDAGTSAPVRVTTIRANGTTYLKQATRSRLNLDSAPLTTGVERFTIGAKEAEAGPNTAAIAWGKAVNGLQAGLRAPGNRSEYHIGDTVRMDYIVRNAGTTDIAFDHEAFMDVAGTCPDVVDAHGRIARTWGLPYLHTSAMAHVKLQPGAMRTLGRTAMRILPPGTVKITPDPAPGPNEQEAIIYLNAVPGSYKMRHLDTLYFQDGAGGKVVLYTEYLPLEVLPE